VRQAQPVILARLGLVRPVVTRALRVARALQAPQETQALQARAQLREVLVLRVALVRQERQGTPALQDRERLPVAAALPATLAHLARLATLALRALVLQAEASVLPEALAHLAQQETQARLVLARREAVQARRVVQAQTARLVILGPQGRALLLEGPETPEALAQRELQETRVLLALVQPLEAQALRAVRVLRGMAGRVRQTATRGP
jgi:hypothetical protein